jgi:hypothetical protein
MSKNKYLEIYEDIFPENSDVYDLNINKSYDLKWLTCGAYDYKNEIEFTKESIINLIDGEYIIFPTNKFYHFNLFGNGLSYFRKTKIICINYYLRYILIQKLNIINELIKSENKKYSKIKSNMIKLLKKENLKPVYFLENEILPNTLYRKITFGQEEVFMSFNIYAFKRIEYKLKTLCQLVEKMGATKIEINYLIKSELENNINIGVIGLNEELNTKINNESKTKKDFKMIHNFNENNQINNMNLNIYDLEKIIEKENEFYISKEQFEADINIKFLLNSRCVNLVENYNTKLIFEYMNKFEKQLITKANKFGLELKFSFDENTKEELYINVDFLNPFKYLDCINGYNISPYSSGFNHLSKLIKKIDYLYHKNEENDKKIENENIISNINCNKEEKELYLMINYFLEAHLKLFNEKKKLLDLIYNTNIDLTKAYNHIINTNFTSEQIQSLFYYYFRDNLSYKSFEKFRNIIIKPLNNIFDFLVKSNYFNVKITNENKYNFYDNILNPNNDKTDECSKLINIEKMVFISYQYHNILDHRLKIMDILEEGLEKIRIKLIKTCDILKNTIYKESEDWEYIFKTIEQIKHGKKNKINELKKKFDIDYSNLYNTKSCLICFPCSKFLTCVNFNSYDFNENKLRKYFELCKKEYNKIYKIEETKDNMECLSNYKCNKNLINYNKKNIQGLIKNYMSKSLLNMSDIIKNKIIKKITFNISDLIPIDYKYINDDNKPQLFISSNKINENGFEVDDFILQILCFLMESHYEDDDIDKKYDLKENFNKIQSEIKYNFELISSEIRNIFDKFFYKENGFFSKDEYNNMNLKKELIDLYINYKVSDIDEKVILVFSLLFESNYLNLSKISSFQSIFNNMYNLLIDIIKNYENHKSIPETIDIKYIKNNFPLSKIILTYQRYKIFFTYEDFANYFLTSYENKDINDNNYPLVYNLKLKLNKISYSTFNKIFEIFKSKININEKYKKIENDITLEFINIYNIYNTNPKIHNYLNKELCNYKECIDEKINNLKNITEEIEKNISFMKLRKIIKNKDDNIYFENLLYSFDTTKTVLFDGIDLIEDILQNNPTYKDRLFEMICNLIMDKYNIKYNDLNNENYDEYINQIKNILFPQLPPSPHISNNFYLELQNEKNDDYLDNNDLFINKSLISNELIEDSSDD